MPAGGLPPDPDGIIKFVDWDCVNYPVRTTAKMPRYGPEQCGWYRFRYSAISGPLHKLNARHMRLFPEWSGATGFECYESPGVVYTWTAYRTTSGSADLYTDTGSVNTMTHAFGGFTPPGGTVDYGSVAGPTHFQMPVPQSKGSPQKVPSPTIPEQEPTNPTNGARRMNFLLTLLGYACEIASRTVEMDDAQNAGTQASVQDNPYVTELLGVMSQAVINVTARLNTEDEKFGPNGLFYLGAWTWAYGERLEEWCWINALNQITRPRGCTPDGLYVWLKPGVHANITYKYNSYGAQGIRSALGEINFLAGEVENFLPSGAE